MRSLLIQMLIIANLACVIRIVTWAYTYYGVGTWYAHDGLSIMVRELSRSLNFWS